MSVSYGKSLLKIDNISKSYGDKAVLKNVNAQVKNIINTDMITGQIVGFLGPSGIGKTTLFRIIAGLLSPTSGKIELLDSQDNVKVGQVGVVAQTYPLLEHRTVLGNLMLAARQKEKDPKVAKDKVNIYLSMFELSGVATHYPAELSGGQRQRCSIIQQILCSEHFLLMDEPFSGLDLLMVEKTISLIKKVASMDSLNTIIICSHDVTSTVACSDHIWMMGRDHDSSGNIIPGARIIKEYSLVESGLCWNPEVITSPVMVDFVRQLKEEFRTL